ncbi:hypothetical protein ACWN8V_13210 [Vagococcus elongatus]|uniref:Uncharacterized protein n=1 Tax=Vagococcus elongatus TaxID=180344 RepID=A0A430AL94_9ENTE|nr:hypothetical protein [Vagococcus elongatus]RSU08865.1 hypothetical protein CBF29_12980 [Vagococcus elongatus]
MALKNLFQFREFNHVKFFEGKVFEFTNVTPWTDFHTKEILGKKVELTIIEDNTEYRKKANGEVPQNNKYEKITVKLHEDISVPLNTKVIIDEIVKVSIYGEYQNQLSIEARRIIPQATFKKGVEK